MLNLKKLLTKLVQRDKDTVKIRFDSFSCNCQPNTRGTLQFSVPSNFFPQGATYKGCIITIYPHNHWIHGVAYYNTSTEQIIFNYINESSNTISGNVIVGTIYTI